MKNRSSDPLTAATTSILKPELAPLGFQKQGTRAFVRVNDGVLQYVGLQLSAWGNKNFAVNYATITLYSPRDYMVLQPGGRLPRGKGGDGWWNSETPEFADNSMRNVVERFNVHCVPWFDRTRTTRGLLDELNEQHDKFLQPHAHFLFDIACSQARLGEVQEAAETLRRAISVYRQWHQEMPAKTWCLECVGRCEMLLTGIQELRHETLLADWYAHSVEKLKLRKTVGT